MKMRVAIICAVFAVATIFAPFAHAAKLGEEQSGLISQNCSSIKLQLQQLQRADAKSRVHIGAQYETIYSNLMLNLNIRLIKNDLVATAVSAEQANFANERKLFKENYINYSQALDKLIAIDCKSAPQDFYEQLKTTQEKRAEVDRSVDRLNKIVAEHKETVKAIQNGLDK